MSVKSTFLALKKVVQFVPIEGRGGGEVFLTKSKRTAAFLRKTFPNDEQFPVSILDFPTMTA